MIHGHDRKGFKMAISNNFRLTCEKDGRSKNYAVPESKVLDGCTASSLEPVNLVHLHAHKSMGGC